MIQTEGSKKRLGRGIGSLLGEISMSDVAAEVASEKKSLVKPENMQMEDEGRVWSVAIEKLVANKFQPRDHFDATKLKELAESIKEQGILQPIVARKTKDNKFEIIAGERRWRAAQLVGLHNVPVILKEIDNQKSLELALIENIQRQDLNIIEEAEAYQRLATEFSLTQEEIAKKVGKERATVANIMRLLSLAQEVKQMLASGALTNGHAKVLLAINDPKKQIEIAKKIIGEKLSVRSAEAMVSLESKKKNKKEEILHEDISKRLAIGLSEDLQRALGTKVLIDYENGRGKLIVNFYTNEQLTQIVEKLKK